LWRAKIGNDSYNNAVYRKEENMSWRKIILFTTTVLFIAGNATIDFALAGEKQKWHGASYTVKWEQIEIGDEDGHVIAIYEQKQVYFDDETGEKTPSTTFGILDLNIKTGQGSGHGYGVTFYKDGDKTFRTWEGKSVGEGHWRGTYSLIKGTGKYERIKGGGTWDSYSLAPRQSYLEGEGETEIPGQ
jgi:hypothetical protein